MKLLEKLDENIYVKISDAMREISRTKSLEVEQNISINSG
jgi:hypothetical protein